MRTSLRLHACALLGALWLLAPAARADEAEDAFKAATTQIGNAATEIDTIAKNVRQAQQGERTPEQQIADAVLLMGVKDWERAADVLNEVVEKYKHQPAVHADAYNLLGETYFQDKQYLSARRIFNDILDRSAEPRFGAFRDRAVVRAVDVALRIRDLDALDALLAKLDSVPAQASSAVAYARGKALFARGNLGAASASLGEVPDDAEFAHQAHYLLGVIAVKEVQPAPVPEGQKPKPVPKGHYARAIDHFQAVTRLPGDTTEHRHVIDLAWMAIGRLLYESSQWTQSVESYNRIDRSSPVFGTMLYELAWVYVKLGDVVRAQRALEVLSVAAPNSQDVADAALLRGDLLLRAGQFEKSFKVYESVRGNYESLRDRVDAFLASTRDAGVFFDTLSRDQLELFEAGAQLPPLVVQWAREGEDGEAAFAVIDDIALCRRLIKQSNEMIDQLNAVLSSPNRIRAVPGLRLSAEKALGLQNGIAISRLRLAHGMDDVEDDVGGELGQVRAQRRELEKRLGLVPVSSSDFASREAQASRQWNLASQALQRLDLEVDTLQATINGLERILKDGPQAGVVRSPGQIQQLQNELVDQRRYVNYYREQIGELRRMTQAGRIQVGFGDSRFVEDAQVRKAFRDILWREVQLASQGQGGAELARYANSLVPILQKGDEVDGRIDVVLADLEKTVASKAGELRQIVAEETQKIVGYSLELEKLDQEARLVVGGVALRNFQAVRTRLKNIVLRADVGITEEAWEVREEQQTRVRRLRVERSRSERRLQEELEEVLDDSVDNNAEEEPEGPTP